ncbi:MAG: hypothetical protein DRJ01_12910 [Bacteroidetes bacterium]|nr:MAG: hypothetical protein DRJ01_12910 [Bacteroidota bacterium]
MNYKICLVYFVLLFWSIQLYSQDKGFEGEKNKPKVQIGYLHLYNKLNADSYFRLKYSNATNNSEANIGGLNLKLDFPTKYKYVDITVGALIMKGFDEIDLGYIDPSSVNAHDYNINGGGVYIGISPKIKGKYISLTSAFGIGVFSFKEYISIVNNSTQPFVDEHNLKASYGLGAISSIGIYLNVGKIGINPSLMGIFSGGSETSFTFYGFNIPLSYQF